MTPQDRAVASPDFHVVPAGDSALLVQLDDRLDSAINDLAIAIARAVRTSGFAGVRDVTSTYRSVAIYFDPLRTDYSTLVDGVTAAAAIAPRTSPTVSQPIRVPVCYGGELGPDLDAVAAFAGIGQDEVIRLHTSRTYRVFMLGFLPGFTYMGTVDERIAVPRLADPRSNVQAGSVGIAGFQTGIYPASTPGGWRIVGRTPIKPFDLHRAEPFMFKPGDAVEFYAIKPVEYSRFESAC
ncbi:MAG TPA: 5-oxoprolinase subunit PxpB [Vicinamibacterales bacterium]|nr:5-oxoprolinase subunit PxpB [Vicinamibacterales bacterium]